jgi:hypothetical protein
MQKVPLTSPQTPELVLDTIKLVRNQGIAFKPLIGEWARGLDPKTSNDKLPLNS